MPKTVDYFSKVKHELSAPFDGVDCIDLDGLSEEELNSIEAEIRYDELAFCRELLRKIERERQWRKEEKNGIAY